jgi:isochorismate synthase
MLADTSCSPLYQAAANRAAQLGRPVLASTTQPTHARDPIALFSQASGTPSRALWLRPDSGEALVGIGAARTLSVHGADRFQAIARAWSDLLAEASVDTSAEQTDLRGPLLLGGFSFGPADPTPLWQGFPPARLVLHQRLLRQRAGAASLTSNVMVGPSQRADADVEAVEAQECPTREAEPGLSAEAWQRLVGEVVRDINQGDQGLRKVVLALACQAHPARSIEAALRTLAEQYPTCTIFAIAEGNSCFLGATPERLIWLRSGTAMTMALAGSAPRGDNPVDDDRIAQRLLSDRKERDEHALVVRALREALEPVCASVVADAQPRVRKLSNLQHLLTPVRGQVQAGRGVLDLVERLHPTPAVGGFPRARALDLIRQHEALDRGWYAGPIGWIDNQGEGEFVVGLRSALVRGNMATLFAGCGIVADSNPATEYAEWGWKLRPMLAALGVES